MELFAIHYRVGGSFRWRWHTSLPMLAREGEAARSATERMGYEARLVPALTPLPTDFEGLAP
jgi:hypothetical protein